MKVKNVEAPREREPHVLMDLNAIMRLTPDRRRGVLALIQVLQSSVCSPLEERAIFLAINELLSNVTTGKSIHPKQVGDRKAGRKVTTFYRHVGETIRLIRHMNRWTQDELARRARIPQPHLSKIETGEHVPTLQTLKRLAKALGTTTDQLAMVEGTPSVVSKKARVKSKRGRGPRRSPVPRVEDCAFRTQSVLLGDAASQPVGI